MNFGDTPKDDGLLTQEDIESALDQAGLKQQTPQNPQSQPQVPQNTQSQPQVPQNTQSQPQEPQNPQSQSPKPQNIGQPVPPQPQPTPAPQVNQQNPAPQTKPGEFGDYAADGTIPLAPTDQETQQGYAAVQQLVKDYTTLTQHINQISQTMKGDFGAWRQVWDTYQQLQQPWRNFQQQIKTNPAMAARINPQSLQAAQQAFQQVLPLLAQQMQEQQQDMVQNQQILQGAAQVLKAIQGLLPNTQPRRASLNAYAASAASLFGKWS